MKTSSHSRDGFALLAVLWMLFGGAILGLLIVLTSRDAQGEALNRVNLARARWVAEGCVERTRAAVEEELSSDDPIPDSIWMHLDGVVVRSPLTQGCSLELTPAGMTLDVNSATELQLHRFFSAAGLPTVTVDSLTDAILDWRDVDDASRESGAERAWYDSAKSVPPLNARLASAEELQFIRGMDAHADVARLLSVEDDRILLSRAPLPILATLPGMTPAAVAIIERLRASGDSQLTVPRIAALLPVESRTVLLANLSSLSAMTTASPDAWLIAASASKGQPSVTARLEIRVVRSGRRLAILRRRSDP